MNQKTYNPTALTCCLQKESEIRNNQCHVGVISKTNGGFRFEEAIRKGRGPRNPKLYDGKYISMVRMQNGRYQMHLKTMDANIDRDNFAFRIYVEVTEALNIMQ